MVFRSGAAPTLSGYVRAFVEDADKLGFEDEGEGEFVLYLQPRDADDDFDESQDG